MTLTRVSSKPTSPEAVLAHIEPGADIVMPNANGEPVELVDTLEEHADELRGVKIHQMRALRERRYIEPTWGYRRIHGSTRARIGCGTVGGPVVHCGGVAARAAPGRDRSRRTVR